VLLDAARPVERGDLKSVIEDWRAGRAVGGVRLVPDDVFVLRCARDLILPQRDLHRLAGGMLYYGDEVAFLCLAAFRVQAKIATPSDRRTVVCIRRYGDH